MYVFSVEAGRYVTNGPWKEKRKQKFTVKRALVAPLIEKINVVFVTPCFFTAVDSRAFT